mmetsp:Transcript_35430/g.54421  ORF Transcript_35430/g.54421 Transcript_35430/m.54421 type:complete len:224 (-) Transcript_35430:211-882(-)
MRFRKPGLFVWFEGRTRNVAEIIPTRRTTHLCARAIGQRFGQGSKSIQITHARVLSQNNISPRKSTRSPHASLVQSICTKKTRTRRTFLLIHNTIIHAKLSNQTHRAKKMNTQSSRNCTTKFKAVVLVLVVANESRNSILCQCMEDTWMHIRGYNSDKAHPEACSSHPSKQQQQQHQQQQQYEPANVCPHKNESRMPAPGEHKKNVQTGFFSLLTPEDDVLMT